jgi:fibronectin-binding autotransporter adhesin
MKHFTSVFKASHPAKRAVSLADTRRSAAEEKSCDGVRLGAFLALCLLCLWAVPALAQCPPGGTCWAGGPLSSWSTSGNWTNGVPTGTLNTFIDNNNANAQGASIVIMDAANGQTANLTIDSDDVLDITNGNSLTVNGGTLSNAGLLGLSSFGGATRLVFGTTATLTGGGTVSLSNNANNTITSANALTNVNNTIEGAGTVLLSLLNQGTVNANQSTPLNINFGEGGSNSGTLEATSGGRLVLSVGFPGNILNNAGGTIFAGNGSEVQLTSSIVIQGGKFNSAGTGLIDIPGGQTVTLDGVTQGPLTNVGNLALRNGGTVNFSGIFNQAGNVFLSSTGATTSLTLTGDTTVTGGGTISLSNNANNQISGFGVNLTNVNDVIEGSGLVTANINNHGTFDANQSTPLLVFVGNGVNTGTMEATNGGTLVLNGGESTLNNKGGTIFACDVSAVQLTNGMTIQGGTLKTTPFGAVSTVVADTATLDGLTQGALTNAGNFSVANFSTLSLQGTIHNTGTLTLVNGSTVNVSGTLDNSGNVFLSSTGNATGLNLTGDTILTGGGTVVMSNAGNNNRIGPFGLGPASLLNVDNLIEGAGSIFVEAGQIINLGTIDANQLTPLIVSFGGSTNSSINSGTVEATLGGTLQLNGGEALPLNNKGGTIFAGDQSEVQLINAAVIQGGTLKTAGQGFIDTVNGDTATLDGVTQGALTNAGNLFVTSGSTLTLQGTIHNSGALIVENDSIANVSGTLDNSGKVLLSAAGAAASLTLTGNTTLSGGGTVSLSNSTNNLITDFGNGFSLISNNLIEGAGLISVNAFGNEGTVRANQSNPLNVVGGSSITNTGTFEVDSGALMHVFGSGTFNNFLGGVLAGGSYEVDAFNNVTHTQGTGTLQIDQLGTTGGEITSLQASLFLGSTSVTLNGTNAAIVDANGNNALALSSIGPSTSLTLKNGASLFTPGDVTNAGSVTLMSSDPSANSLLQTAGNYTQTAGQTIIGARGDLRTSVFTQTGGLTEVDQTLEATHGMFLRGGDLTGTSLIIANVDNTGGRLQPIDPIVPSTLTIAGNYTQGAGGSLFIDLAGASPGQFSVLDVLADATLDGTVDFVAINGFTPEVGDAFTFLLFSSEVGDFSNVVFTGWSCPAGATCEEVFGSNSLTLEIISETPSVPEPSSLALSVTGFLSLAGLAWRRNRRPR